MPRIRDTTPIYVGIAIAAFAAIIAMSVPEFVHNAVPWLAGVTVGVLLTNILVMRNS